jgi:hypothetical protein
MSHHVTATATNPSGAVEVVHVAAGAAAASAPLDLGSAGSGGLVKASTTQVEGVSKTAGANLPTENIEAASNTIQRGKADLSATAGAETRLNQLDLVGGGGGGGGGQQDADTAVAANNPDVDQLKTETSLNAGGGDATTTGDPTGGTAGTTGGTTGGLSTDPNALTVNDLPGGAQPANPIGTNGLPQQDIRSLR